MLYQKNEMKDLLFLIQKIEFKFFMWGMISFDAFSSRGWFGGRAFILPVLGCNMKRERWRLILSSGTTAKGESVP